MDNQDGVEVIFRRNYHRSCSAEWVLLSLGLQISETKHRLFQSGKAKRRTLDFYLKRTEDGPVLLLQPATRGGPLSRDFPVVVVILFLTISPTHD